MMTCIEYDFINEKVYSKTLPNGLPVYVVQKKDFSKKHALFAVNYGSVDRRFSTGEKWTDTPTGTAHFLEHIMFENKDGNMLKKLSQNGASPNGYTSADTTAYYFECTDKFAKNLEYLLRCVSTPYITSEEIEKERGIISQEIFMCEDDPDDCLSHDFLNALFRYNTIRDPILGTIESISEINANTLLMCHETYYNPSNTALCVSGDVEPSEVFDIAERTLQGNHGDFIQRDYGQPEGMLPVTQQTTRVMDVSIPIMMAGCKSAPSALGKERLRQEIISAIALEVLGGHSSTLFSCLYNEGLVNHDFSVSFDVGAGVTYTSFSCESHEPDRVFDKLKSEVIRLAEHGPDSSLFNRTKKALLGSHIRAFNSFGSICAGVVDGHFLGYNAFEAPEVLSSVTESEVIEFLRENLFTENMAISIVFPRE